MNFYTQLSNCFTTAQMLELFLRIIVACLCGALLGLERAKRYKEAGIRTHCVITAAAAAIMIVSKYGFADLLIAGVFQAGTKGADPSRIASQIVSGVGFLGVGMIFKNGNNIRGLTSAAGIWASAAVGMIIGSGLYWVGIFLTVTIIVVLIGVRFLNIDNEVSHTRILMTISRSEEERRELFDRFSRERLKILSIRIKGRGELLDLEMMICGKARISEEQLFRILNDIPEITEITI